MKFYLPTLKHFIIELAKLQIYTLNLTTPFWHCQKKSHYFWTGVYVRRWRLIRRGVKQAWDSAEYYRKLNTPVNTLRPRQNGRHFADDTFKRIFLNENVRNSIKNSLKFAPRGRIHNIPPLVQIMAWRRTGDKPLSESMMTQFNDAYMRHSASKS